MSERISLPNPSLVVYGLDRLEVRQLPVSLPASSEGKPVVPEGCVLVSVKATGICGSDIHLWKLGSARDIKVIDPYVLGHECAGEIIAIGEKVSSSWKTGDRIAIKPGSPCLICDDCTTGQSNLCTRITYFGIPGCDGSCCSYQIVPERQLVRLTPKISWVEAGIIQPLAICLHMSRQANLKAYQDVMILGGGCIGLLLGALAKSVGARRVVVLEKLAHRAKFAGTYCADQVFQSPPREQGETTSAYSVRVSKHILDSTLGLQRGFDVCIEASGAEECMQMGIRLCKPGGTYVQVGMYRGKDPEIPMQQVLLKQLTVRGTIRYTTNCFEQAVDLIDRDIIDVKSLVSHVYYFKDVLEGFEAVHKVQDRHGKALLKAVILHNDEKDESKGGWTNGVEKAPKDKLSDSTGRIMIGDSIVS